MESLNPTCSVLITTWNRASTLRLVLESLCAQSLPRSRFEAIVVDDGSTDATAQVVDSFRDRLPIRYEYQRNAGIASARNHALFLASHDIVLFQDDDDIASPTLLAEHLQSHQAHPQDEIAVLGRTNLTPGLCRDPLMRYVTLLGQWLYSYPSIQHGSVLDFSYFWGGRTSCKRRFLLERGVFNPVFRFGCEDIELGFRLSRHGLRVIYNARAMSTTVRAISFDAFCHRLARQGASNAVFSQLHDDPLVQRWTEVDQATRWEALAPRYEMILKAARTCDAAVRAKLRMGRPTEEDETPLFEAYEAAFRASRIKGLAEKLREQHERPKSPSRRESPPPIA